MRAPRCLRLGLAWGAGALLGAALPAVRAAAQLPARPDPAEPAVTVRVAPGTARAVPVYTIAAPAGVARYVSAADLAGALRGTVDVRGDRARLVVAGVTVDVIDGVAFAHVGRDGREVPLAASPRVLGGRALLPLQLVADALPGAAAGGLRFDALPRTLAVVTAPAPPAEPPTVTLPSIIGTPRPRPAPETEDAVPLPAVAGRRRTVVVDAGHGGVDGGMRGTPAGGPVVSEKDVTLGVARALRTALAERGFDVVLTRDRDVLIPLAERGRIANARHGDLFVSVHVNAANPRWRDPGAARGFETYFLSEARTDEAREVAARENESVRYEAPASADSADPLRFIVSDLAQNEHLRVSQRLAQVVQRRLGRVHPGPNRGVHQAGFKVLVTASMPAVLVEVGFGSNAADAEYITGAAGQRAIAEAIADAAVEHLGRYGAGRGGADRGVAERRP